MSQPRSAFAGPPESAVTHEASKAIAAASPKIRGKATEETAFFIA